MVAYDNLVLPVILVEDLLAVVDGVPALVAARSDFVLEVVILIAPKGDARRLRESGAVATRTMASTAARIISLRISLLLACAGFIAKISGVLCTVQVNM